MRLLYISHCLPFPPNKGDRVRAFHAIRVLASRGHEIHLFALAKPDEDLSGQEALKEICETVEVFPIRKLAAQLRSVFALVGVRPLTHAYFRSVEMQNRVALQHQHRPFDAVIAYSSAVAPYAQRLRGLPRVLDIVDVDSQKWAQYAKSAGFPQSFVFGQEARRLRRYEKEVSQSFDGVLVTTAREEKILQEMAPSGRYLRIRNGVAPDFFQPSLMEKSALPTVSFMGQMDYLPNVDAAEFLVLQVLPLLRERFPSIRVLIIGRSPTARVRQLGSQPGVEVTGAVDDVRPFLAESWVFVAPLRLAQGIQNKVLEATAMGLPVVVSGGVMAGMADAGFVPEQEVVIADTAAELAGALTRLLEDEPLRQRLSRACGERVRAVYDWDRNFLDLEALLERLVDVRGAGETEATAASRLAR